MALPAVPAVSDIASQLQRAETFGHRFEAPPRDGGSVATPVPAMAGDGPHAPGAVIQRTSFRSSTVEQRVRRRGRTTRTSQRARTGLRHLPANVPMDHLLPGTYAHGRASRGREINRGRQTPLRIEVDHIPTDGSQRGAEPRSSARNRLATMARTAMPLPRTVHRLHPTTSGGSNYDRGAMAGVEAGLNRGYPHVGTAAAARQRGFAASMGVHLAGYASTRHRWPRFGANVYSGMQSAAENAARAAHAQGRIGEAQRDELIARGRRTFAQS